MMETLPGVPMPSGFTTVNSSTCTASPMLSGTGTAPLEASADGVATPVVTRVSSAAQPPSPRTLFHPPSQSRSGLSIGCGAGGSIVTPDALSGGISFLTFNACAERVTPPARLKMLQCDIALPAGYS